MTLDAERGLDVRAARNLDGAQVGAPGMRPSRTVVRRAVADGAPVRVGRAQDDTHLGDQDSVSGGALQSTQAVPVLDGDAVAAVVWVDSTRPGGFGAALEERRPRAARPPGLGRGQIACVSPSRSPGGPRPRGGADRGTRSVGARLTRGPGLALPRSEGPMDPRCLALPLVVALSLLGPPPGPLARRRQAPVLSIENLRDDRGLRVRRRRDGTDARYAVYPKNSPTLRPKPGRSPESSRRRSVRNRLVSRARAASGVRAKASVSSAGSPACMRAWSFWAVS